MINQKWQRIILLFILAYEAWGGVTGGTLLTFASDGPIMKMSADIMHGFFPNFLIPGLILTGMGVLSTIAFFELFYRAKKGWFFSLLSMGGYIIWFAVEILIVGTNWLQIMWGIPVVVGFILALPMIPKTALNRITISV